MSQSKIPPVHCTCNVRTIMRKLQRVREYDWNMLVLSRFNQLKFPQIIKYRYKYVRVLIINAISSLEIRFFVLIHTISKIIFPSKRAYRFMCFNILKLTKWSGRRNWKSLKSQSYRGEECKDAFPNLMTPDLYYISVWVWFLKIFS